MSTDVLSFDGVFVEQHKKKIHTLFYKYPSLLKDFRETHPKAVREKRKLLLKEEEIKVLQSSYTFNKEQGRYATQQEQAKQFGISQPTFSFKLKKINEKLQNSKVCESLANTYPDLLEAKMIYENYRTIPKTPSQKVVLMEEATVLALQHSARINGIPNITVAKTKKENTTKTTDASSPFSHLEASVFKDYISLCNEEQKLILALRLGYFNNYVYSTEEVANMCHISQEEVSLLTKNCLASGKEALNQAGKNKGIQKRKSNCPKKSV